MENIHVFTIKKKSYTDDDVPVYEDLFAVYLEKTAKGIIDAKNAQLSKEEIKEEVSYVYKRLLLKEY